MQRKGDDDIQSMDNTRDITQDCQTDVDQEVSTTSFLKEDAQRRQDNSKDDLAKVPEQMKRAESVENSRMILVGAR